MKKLFIVILGGIFLCFPKKSIAQCCAKSTVLEDSITLRPMLQKYNINPFNDYDSEAYPHIVDWVNNQKDGKAGLLDPKMANCVFVQSGKKDIFKIYCITWSDKEAAWGVVGPMGGAEATTFYKGMVLLSNN